MSEDPTSAADGEPPAGQANERGPDAPTMEGVRPAPWSPESATMTHAEALPGAGPLALERGARVDRYTILDRIAAGGMGEVYAAYDTKLDRRVALKLLLHGGIEYEQRLAREAQGMARLSHPNVVGVFDTGKVNDRLFLAMEFVEGRTLRAWTREAPRSVGEVVKVYTEAGRGLAAAHGAGLVHRDFKPDNVLISSEGVVKVTDFGLVRAEAEGDRLWLQQEGYLALGPITGAGSGDAPTQGELPEPSEERSRGPTIAAAIPLDRSSGSLDVPMTEDGALLGTLGYMAPEQYLSDPVNAQTDQFSFCVALYDALYGQKPFAGKGAAELASAALNGEVREPPKGHRVPARIHRVLLRGLRPAKDERYPSMEALLADLGREPARHRNRVALGALGLLAAAALLVFAQRVATARHSRLCTGGESLAREVWNDETRQAIEGAVLATGAPYAADTWARTRSTIDGYMTLWSAAHRRTCEATRIDGSQSEQAMTLRMACLERRRRGVRALAIVLRKADLDVAANAHPAALDLAVLDACKDATALASVEAEPGDTAKRAELASLQDDLATLEATVRVGRLDEGASLAAPLVERARKLGYAPALAEALLWSGRSKVLSARDTALVEWAESTFQADTGRDDAVRAEGATLLMSGLAATGALTHADEWSRVTDATLQRRGDVGLGRARWLEARGMVASLESKPGEAAAAQSEALAIARSAGDLRLAADLERGLAVSRSRLGEVSEARRLAAEADDTLVRVLGDSHPGRVPFLHARAVVAGATSATDGFASEVAAIALAERVAPAFPDLPMMYGEACRYALASGDTDGAVGACWQSFVRYDKLGRHDLTYAGALRDLGMAELASGKDSDAAATLERAVSAATDLGDDTAEARRLVAGASFGLARALSGPGGAGVRTARVSELLRAAEQGFRAAGDERAQRELLAWRSAHTPR